MFERLKVAAYYVCLVVMGLLFLIHFWLVLFPPKPDEFFVTPSHATKYRQLPDASDLPTRGL